MLFLQDVHRTASLISGNERERNLSRGQGRGVTFVALINLALIIEETLNVLKTLPASYADVQSQMK